MLPEVLILEKGKLNTAMEWFEWINAPDESLWRSVGPLQYLHRLCYLSLFEHTGSLLGIKWVNGAWLFSIDLGIHGEEHLNRHAAQDQETHELYDKLGVGAATTKDVSLTAAK